VATSDLAVVLAAGQGSRLSKRFQDIPKPLVPVLGLPLVERVMLACREAGIREFLVVLGYEHQKVRDRIKQIATARGWSVSFVVADRWWLGNGTSALAAAQKVGNQRFLLLMADHLVSPVLIRRVLEAPPRAREIVLAIDRDDKGLFDPPDATKARIVDGRVTSLGKKLRDWNAVDTGVFHCTGALFDGLEQAGVDDRHSLSDGINELARQGRVVAVDITGHSWLDVDTAEAHREARRRLLRSLAKPAEDGFVSTYLNRPISTRISARLADTPVSPNQISVVSFLMAITAAALFAAGAHLMALIGALLLQVSSILDGSDGEVARLRRAASPRGGWLDTILDRYADVAVAIGVTAGFARLDPASVAWLGGMVAVTGFILASYSTKEFRLRFGYSYPNDVFNRLKKRDLRLLVIALGAAFGQPFAALVGVGILSHLSVAAVLVRGWSSHPRPSGRVLS
jgi:CDP-L-myo-inositol myo-inositolphosphotransferase